MRSDKQSLARLLMKNLLDCAVKSGAKLLAGDKKSTDGDIPSMSEMVVLYEQSIF